MSAEAIAAIFGMALVTLGIRAAGYLVANRLPTTGFVAAWMRHIPGAVLASLVAPAVVSGGPAELLATLATALAYLLTRNLFATMATGVAAVYFARLLLGS